MKATVQIKMNGSAFDAPHAHLELSRILNKLADSVERNIIEEVGHECAVADINGNFSAYTAGYRDGTNKNKLSTRSSGKR